MQTKWDVIVIGAGLGGLSAAGLLARSGKRVLVLEQHEGVGGYAQGMRRNGYYFDFSLRSLDGVAPGGWAHMPLQKLGILERVHFERLDPYYVARYPGREIVAAADPMQYESELIRHFPGEADGIRSLFDEMRTIYLETHRMRADEVLDRRMPPEEMLRRYPTIIRASRETWADFMARHIQSAELKAIFSTQWPSCGLPPSRLNAVALVQLWISSHHYGGFYPRGGSAAVNRALVEVIDEGGGQILCGQKVTEICIEGGVATGVQTAAGLAPRADVIISNANPAQTMRLIDPQYLPPGYRTRIDVTPDSLSSFNIYLGVDRSRLQGGALPHEVYVSAGYDPEAEYEAIRQGNWEEVPYLLAHYTAVDPTGAPPGHAVLSLMCLAPWHYRHVWESHGDLDNYRQNPAYQAVKEEVAERLLARAEQEIPGLRTAITFKEIATPLTNARYTLNRSGAIFGFEQSVDGMYHCRLDEETPIPNLFLAGAWTQPGGGQSAVMLSGYDAMLHANKSIKALGENGHKHQPRPARPKASQNGALPLNSQAPPFTITAVGANRPISLQSCAGRPLVLLFVSQNTTAAIGQLNGEIRCRFPLAAQVTVASVVSLGQVPAFFHGLINLALKRAYKKAAAEVPPDFDPADYVLILPDWDGKVCNAYGVQNVEREAAVVVIDRAGVVQATIQGPDLVEATIETVKWL
jgi:phytoene desaturase